MSKTAKRKGEDNQRFKSKKQKVEHQAVRNNPTSRKRVHGDALKWRTVDLPDRLDDAEGFFGLEEIEDVEVLRDENSGAVTFKPRSDAELVEQETSEDDVQSWSGFDEDETNEVASQTSGSDLVARTESAIPTKKQDADSKPQLQDSIDFTILDDINAEPTADLSAWRILELSDPLLTAVGRLNFSKPTPIQSMAIPQILKGQDVIGKAVTGSGKTLAFGLPIFEAWLKLLSDRSASQKSKNPLIVKDPIALILAPTRELAHQLTKHLSALGSGLDTSPRITTITGGLSILKQQRQIETADIVIGTPGRMWEVLNDPNSPAGLIDKIRRIRFLVVDEADRLLSEGHFKEVEQILDLLDKKTTNDDEDDVENRSENATRDVAASSSKSKTHLNPRQTLVFSATFNKNLHQKLAAKGRLNQSLTSDDLLSNEQSMEYLLRKLSFRSSKPTFIDANPTSQMSEQLAESIVECGAMEKDLHLYTLLLENPAQKTLVFTNSVSSVKRLTPLLQTLNLPASGLHSHMPQKSRLRSLERFAAGSSRTSTNSNNSQATLIPKPHSGLDTSTPKTQRSILVASDVAARGLDIPSVDLIIHYHIPRSADTYIHRSGRTARAEKLGRSIMMCSPDEVVPVTRLIARVHQSSSSSTSSNHNTPSTQTIDGRLLRKLQPRVQLAQKITSTNTAVHASTSEDAWLRNAAEELGVEYDVEEFAKSAQRQKRGRGKTDVANKLPKNSRVREEDEDDLYENENSAQKGHVGNNKTSNKNTKAQMRQWKEELSGMLNTRLKLGGIRAEKFLAGGAVDVDQLLALRG